MARPVIRLSEAVDEFLESRLARGFSPNTNRTSRQALDRLLEEAGNLYVKSIGPKHIDAVFSAKAAVWSKATGQLMLTHYRSFFAWCRQRGYISKDTDPCAGWKIRKQKPADALRIPVTRFNELLDAAEHPRDRMYVALGLFLFLRSSEITALKIKHVDLAAGTIKVKIFKTDDLDHMPISEELDAELRRYLTWYTERHGVPDPEWYLVPAKDAPVVKWVEGQLTVMNKISRLRPLRQMGQPYLMVRRIVESLGYSGHRVGGHTLRRSGARAYFDHLGDEGYDRALQRVRAMLHHSTASMTELYLGLDVEKHQRDERLRGQTMFPAMKRQANVLELKGPDGRAIDQGV